MHVYHLGVNATAMARAALQQAFRYQRAHAVLLAQMMTRRSVVARECTVVIAPQVGHRSHPPSPSHFPLLYLILINLLQMTAVSRLFQHLSMEIRSRSMVRHQTARW